MKFSVHPYLASQWNESVQIQNLAGSAQKLGLLSKNHFPPLIGLTVGPASERAKQTGMSLAENTSLTLQFDAASAEKERKAVFAKMLPPMPPKPKTAMPIAPVIPAAKGTVASTTKLITYKDEAEARKERQQTQLQSAIQASKVQAKAELEERIRKLKPKS